MITHSYGSWMFYWKYYWLRYVSDVSSWCFWVCGTSTGSPLKLIHYLYCMPSRRSSGNCLITIKNPGANEVHAVTEALRRGGPGAFQREKIWDTWNQLKTPRLASSSYAFLFPPFFTFSLFSSLFLHLATCTGKLPSTCYLRIQKISVQASWRGVCKCRTIPKSGLLLNIISMRFTS